LFSFIERNRVYLIYTPLTIYWLVIFILTSLPGNIALDMHVSDKIEHFGAYGLLGVFLYSALYFQKKYKILSENPATFTLIFASLYGMVDELHQLFVPGRSADILDWTADFIGSVLAVIITKFIIEKLKEAELKKSL
jgi:VanZ family protein